MPDHRLPPCPEWRSGDTAWVYQGPPARKRWSRDYAERPGTWQEVTLAHDPLPDGNRWVVATAHADGTDAGFRVCPELHTHRCADPLHSIDATPCPLPRRAEQPDES